MRPKGHDARLLSLPEGVQVMRDNKIRYYWYNQITDTSRRRLWRLMDSCSQLASNPDMHIWQRRSQADNHPLREASETMRRQTRTKPIYTEATVPLSRDYLCQPAMVDPLFPGRRYALPVVAPGAEARVVDSDYHWQTYNGLQGEVTQYSFFTGYHTILFNGVHEWKFQGREITKGRR
jgi:hypothetical protein